MNEFLESINVATCECIVNDKFESASPCLVCGEAVMVSNFGPHVVICEKCKQAILYMRG